MTGDGQLQSAVTDTLELDCNVCASRLLSEKNGVYIVIPGTAPYAADDGFLFAAIVRAVATPTASCRSDPPFFYKKHLS